MKKLLVIGAVVIFIIAGSVGTFFFLQKKPAESQKQTQSDVNKISDESLGISFEIDKSFVRIEQKELVSINPYFIYGFQPEDVSEVSCSISQTKMTSPGAVTPEYLKDGTFDQIKKTYPDAVLDNWSVVDFGNNLYGAKLSMSLKEGDKSVTQIEVIGSTGEKTIFVFCSCPKSLGEFYQSKFNLFLDSLKIW